MNELEKYYRELLRLTGAVTILFYILPVGAAFIYRKNLDKPLVVFRNFLIINFFINIFHRIYSWGIKEYPGFWTPVLQNLNIQNSHFINILVFLNLIITCGLFFICILETFKPVAILKLCLAVLSGISLFVFFFVEGHNNFGTFGPLIPSLWIIFLAAGCIWHISYSPPVISINKNPWYIISITLFLFYLIGLVLMFTGNKIYIDNKAQFFKLYIFRNAFDIACQFVFAYAFYLSKYTKYLNR